MTNQQPNPTALRDRIAAAIRAATCPGNCGQTEEECTAQRIQPVVWHHGILAEVDGTPEQFADAVLPLVTTDADDSSATHNPLVVTDRILTEILAERTLHDDHHGQTTHPDIDTRDIDSITHGPYRQTAERWQAVNDERAQLTHTQGRCQITEPHPHTAWDGLLLEKAYAALAEAHPVRLRARLIHLATMTVEWIEDVDRRLAAAAADYVPSGGYVRSDGVDCCAHAVPVGPGSCEHCWDLVKWDLLAGAEVPR